MSDDSDDGLFSKLKLIKGLKELVFIKKYE